MKKLFLIANWKSNKTLQEAEKWLHDFQEKLTSENLDLSYKEIIICPSFTSLEHVNYCCKNLNLPIQIGVQNISPYETGAYTGEVNGVQIKELANYVIIGHSERRDNFSEDNKIIEKKVEMANKHDVSAIFCIQNAQTPIPENIKIVAYEPPTAIGTGNPDTPENAEEVAKNVKEKTGIETILYGGSVTSKNINSFTKMPTINGALVGGASLDPFEFLRIVKNA
ncbi:MAG: triosephosphate isomerase [Candidatus Levybacteria bacterium]|nr:triosephosphate isomerase [Candidatus Levybacteria bacterium]